MLANFGVGQGPAQAAMARLKRRGLAASAPCARLLTTLLGDDALCWLTAPSSRGIPRARRPNLHSLKEAGIALAPLAPLRALLEGEPAPDDAAWCHALATAVVHTLEQTAATAPDGDPADLWATALEVLPCVTMHPGMEGLPGLAGAAVAQARGRGASAR